MTNIEVCARISETGIDVVEFNGFPYSVVKIDVSNLTGFYAFVPLYCSVEVGNIFISKVWSITTYNKSADDRVLAARFDNVELVADEDAKISSTFRAKVTGMLLTSDKCMLRYVGPVRKPFYRCTLRICDEAKNPYGILLVGFKEAALQLSAIPCQSIVRAEVNIRMQKWENAYEMCIDNSIKVVEKGLTAEDFERKEENKE